MDDIRIPELKLSQAEALIKKHDLGGIIELDGYDLHLTFDSMSYGTSLQVTDHLFPELAELLKDTPEDGQLIRTTCDDDITNYFFYNGKTEEISGDLVTITPELPIPVGQTVSINLPVRVLGLPDGKAAIVEYNAK
jgi:hypothetical protein